MNHKKCHKIAIYRKGDILGLEDMIIWGKYGYSVECIENNSEILKVNLLVMIHLILGV